MKIKSAILNISFLSQKKAILHHLEKRKAIKVTWDITCTSWIPEKEYSTFPLLLKQTLKCYHKKCHIKKVTYSRTTFHLNHPASPR